MWMIYSQYSNPVSLYSLVYQNFVNTKLRLNLSDIKKCPNREICFLFSGGWDWRRLASRVLGEFDVFYIHNHFFVKALHLFKLQYKHTYHRHHLWRNFTLWNVKKAFVTFMSLLPIFFFKYKCLKKRHDMGI